MEKQLPKNWIETDLNKITSYVIGGDWGKEISLIDDDFVEVLCIRGSEIKNWNRNKGNTSSLRKIKKNSLNNRELKYGDILLEISGGGPDQPVGRTVFIDNEVLDFKPEIKKVCTNFLRLVRVYENIDSKYINHYLQYFYFSGEITKYQGGSNNLRNLKFKEYEKITIPLPPLAEQNRIVARLDTFFAQLEGIKSSMVNIPLLLKNFRKQVLTHAVTGKLTEEWAKTRELKEWEESVLKNVCSRITVGFVGKTVDKYRDSGIPFLRSQNVRAFKYDNKNLMYIDEDFHNQIKKSSLSAGDVAIVRSGYPGTTCVIPENILIANCSDILLLTTKAEVLNPHFVAIFMNSEIGKEIVFQGKVGMAQQHFNTKKLQNTSLSLPSIIEQEEIVRRVKSFFAKADAIEEQYKTLQQKTETLPQALLHKAFKGELTEQWDSDGDGRGILKEINNLTQAKISKKK